MSPQKNSANKKPGKQHSPSFSNFFSVKNVAEILFLSESKIYQLVESGKLIAHRIDGSIRISPTDLAKYLAECREEREPEQKPAPHPKLKHIKI